VYICDDFIDTVLK